MKRTIEFYWSGDDLGHSSSETITVDVPDRLFYEGKATEEEEESVESCLQLFGERMALDFEADGWWTEKMRKEADEWARQEMEKQ